ncbi:acetyl-CoA hydrolase/transferase family protein [Robertkochia aurantiaca]|uniref:acetyl-CoA hydrolase/transferase family protein n=1 Tax=Robertkochia aurantiaca TaxID=2873700 RepID=UPI001CCEB6A7|nr:acetyl-CoA hydrolase/transferase C-terminal domain-containing protein [Robertkochia sp. 3YJGBD-33]
MNIVSTAEAVSVVKSGNRLFIQGAAMTPNTLINALCERHQELSDVEIIHIHTEGVAPYVHPPYNNAFRVRSLFMGANVRDAVNADYVPIFLSEIHWLFRKKILPVDVAFIQVSPPDKHGYCSLGVSVDITLPALQNAKIVVAQINPKVPRTHGDGIIHIDQIDRAIEVDEPIHAAHLKPVSDTEMAIGKHVASLIEDGATLQMGIGNIPNAVLSNLGNHKDLGIHTEMFSDGILPLVKKGVINGCRKEVKTGKIVTCFAVGSQELYDFIDDNPLVHFKEAAYTNDTGIIRKNPKVTAINSAIEIDLTGQICADTIGGRQYSGVGGQMDFIRGASLSPGGKPIIAMPSTTRNGQSKIVSALKAGAGVTTTRAHVHYVVTEYGIANLFGKTLTERAKALIDIAHPDHREALAKEVLEGAFV